MIVQVDPLVFNVMMVFIYLSMKLTIMKLNVKNALRIVIYAIKISLMNFIAPLVQGIYTFKMINVCLSVEQDSLNFKVLSKGIFVKNVNQPVTFVHILKYVMLVLTNLLVPNAAWGIIKQIWEVVLGVVVIV